MYVNTGYRVVYLTQKRKLTLESSINNYFLNTKINIEQIKCHSHVSEYGDSGKCENPKYKEWLFCKHSYKFSLYCK